MLSLPKIFASGMVFQRQKPILIWGTAAPDELVTICMRHHKASVTADETGFWRAELPFLIVQLPGWESWFGFANEGFHVIRQCQQEAADADANIHLCSISDAGERLDIHLKDKKVVGERLALLALGHVYGRDLLCDPPRLKSVSRDGERVILTLTNTGTGLYIEGETIPGLRKDQKDRLDYTHF